MSSDPQPQLPRRISSQVGALVIEASQRSASMQIHASCQLRRKKRGREELQVTDVVAQS